MPTAPPRVCPRCHTTVTGPCPTCAPQQRRDSDAQRETAAARGYGHHWRTAIRAPYLAAHPLCVQCGRLATVVDHHPLTRRTLILQGVPDPDGWHRLRALCKPCHDQHTAHTTPGGWANRRPARREDTAP